MLSLQGKTRRKRSREKTPQRFQGADAAGGGDTAVTLLKQFPASGKGKDGERSALPQAVRYGVKTRSGAGGAAACLQPRRAVAGDRGGLDAHRVGKVPRQRGEKAGADDPCRRRSSDCRKDGLP